MARVFVNEIYVHKLANGSTQVLDPTKGKEGAKTDAPDFLTVKRSVADGLVACSRGGLHTTDSKKGD